MRGRPHAAAAFGKITNVLAGVLVLGVLSNGLVLLDVSQFVQMVIKGSVLMVAVALDCLQHRKAA